MALARTNRTSGTDTSHTTSFTSASFTPSDNSLLVVVVGVNDANPQGSWSVVGGSLTWTSRAVITGSSNESGWSVKLQIFTAPVTTGASMTVQVTDGTEANNSWIWHVFDYTGYNTGDPVGGSATLDPLNTGDQGTGDPMTLSATPATDSMVVAARLLGLNSGTPTATPGAGWTEILDTAEDGFAALETQERTGSASTTVTWTELNDTAADVDGDAQLGVAIEIKADAGGGVSTGPGSGLLYSRLLHPRSLVR